MNSENKELNGEEGLRRKGEWRPENEDSDADATFACFAYSFNDGTKGGVLAHRMDT